MTTAPAATLTRGQFLALIGAARNDDGSYRLKDPCPACGATRAKVEWSKAAGIDGRIWHDPDEDEGCEMTTHEAIAGKLPEAPAPEVVTPPQLEIVADAPAYDGPIEFVQFVHPVMDNMPYWSRIKHAGKYKLSVAPPFLIIEFGNQRVRVSMANVAFIRERV